MRVFEATFICSPRLSPEKIAEIIERIKKLLGQERAVVSTIQEVGLKKLAYPIQHHREGYYIYLEFSGLPETANKLRNFFQVTDGIIRYLILKMKEKSLPENPPRVESVESEEVKTDGKS